VSSSDGRKSGRKELKEVNNHVKTVLGILSPRILRIEKKWSKAIAEFAKGVIEEYEAI
jgi:hypothetical protein